MANTQFNPKGLKTISVTPVRHPSFTENSNNHQAVFIRNKDENYVISVDTLEEGSASTVRDKSLIRIGLQNGKKWSGTIQDFVSILDTAQAIQFHLEHECDPFKDNEEMKNKLLSIINRFS